MKKIIQVAVVLLSLILVGVPEGMAAELNFSVNPVLPETQQDKDKSYFDIKLGIGEKETLKVILKNGTDKEVVVEISINRATTNLNGVVEYGERNEAEDKSLIYNIEDLITIPETSITIPAHGEKEVNMELIAPDQSFEGILTGGLTFKEKNKNTENGNEEENKGLAIKNEYAYVVGVVLHGENENLPSNVKLTKVEAAQVNARNVINATLENPQAKYINQLSIKAEVTKKGSSEVLYSTSKENMQMAPNSHFAFPVQLEGKPLKPGNYTMNMLVSSLSDKWTLSKDFTISKETADKYNAKDVSIEDDSTWIYVLIGVSGLLLVVIISYVVYRHRKKEKLRKELLRKRARQRKKQKQRKQSKSKN